MSDTEMDTPAPSTQGGPSLKICKPDLYYGDRDKLKSWILQFDRHFHVEGDRIADDDKVVFATTYMRGDAEKWVTPILERYMDPGIRDASNTRLVENWEQFKVRLRQIFSPVKEAVIAEQKIQNLRQTKSAADYTTTFQQYAAQISWDDNALMRMYKQGLKPQVRAELMRSGTTINTLATLVNESIRLDNELYELALEERTYRGRPARDEGRRDHGRNRRHVKPNQGRYRTSYQPRIAGAYQTYGNEPMHLDNINHGGNRQHQGRGQGQKKDAQKKQNDPETRSCYTCGKPGHLSKNCRSKNKVIRQVNMIQTSGNEEEWEVITPPESEAEQLEQSPPDSDDRLNETL